jgi:hypothetical protein
LGLLFSFCMCLWELGNNSQCSYSQIRKVGYVCLLCKIRKKWSKWANFIGG